MRCDTEANDSQTTTRAHSIATTGEDGGQIRFFVSLCERCFDVLERQAQLDAFAQKALESRKDPSSH